MMNMTGSRLIRLGLVSVTCFLAMQSMAQERMAPWDKQGAQPRLSDSYWGHKEQGYFWYKDEEDRKKREAEKVEQAAKSPQKNAEDERKQALKEFEELKKAIDEQLKIAYMTGKREDVELFLRLQKKMIAMTSRFADTAQRVVWVTPELDASMSARPTTDLAMKTYDEIQRNNEEESLRALAQTNGLFFFFRGDCPYCHKFAPVLKRFADEFGFKVFPISLDGGGLPEFTQYQNDNGIAAKLGVQSVPATFLVSPDTKTIQPIGYGALAVSELRERMYAMTQVPIGQR
jgi:conjugal transfer pilus assembly protein TraF